MSKANPAKSFDTLENEVLSTTSSFSLKRLLTGRSSHISNLDNATESFGLSKAGRSLKRLPRHPGTTKTKRKRHQSLHS